MTKTNDCKLGERIATYGSSTLGDAELLSLATGMTEPAARKLLVRSNGLAALRTMAVNELIDAGMSVRSAQAFFSTMALIRRAEVEDTFRRTTAVLGRIRCVAELANHVRALIGHEETERLLVLGFSSSARIVFAEVVAVGGLNVTNVVPREILTPCVRHRVAGFAIAHNHPSGDVMPSPSDVRLTQDVYRSGRLLGLDLVDHIIAGPSEEFYSFAEKMEGLLREGRHPGDPA